MSSAGDPTGARDARLALLYLEAARRVLGPKHSGGLPDMAMMEGPVSFLIAHAVELALGALLRSFGLRGTKKENHNLADRLSRLEGRGVVFPDLFKSYVRLNNPAHQRGQFRYPREVQDPFVDAWLALDIVTPVLEMIERHAAGEPSMATPRRDN